MTLTDTKILICAQEFLDETLKLLLDRAGFWNVELAPDDDCEFFARYRPGEYGLFIVQPTSKLGKMYGPVLLSEVRKRDRRAKFLVVSGMDEAWVQGFLCQDGLDPGEYTYLGIPCEFNALLTAIESALADHTSNSDAIGNPI